MYKLEFSNQGNDKEKLKNFLIQVEKLLADLVETGEDSQGNKIVIDALVPAMQSAWKGSSPSDGAPARFERVRERVASASAQELEPHGLQGPMLTFKLAVLGHWAERYNLLGGWRWLDKILELIDTLLESILSALGIDGGLAELKDFVGGSVEEG